MKLLCCFLFLIFIVMACHRDEPIGKDSYTNFYYKQTYCADPWPTGNTDSITLVNVAGYLKSLNLYIAGLSIKLDDNIEMCLACTCKTGKTIYVATLKSDSLKARYIRAGFKQ